MSPHLSRISPAIALLIAGCGHDSGTRSGPLGYGATQDQLRSRLRSDERVLFRDARMMIIEGPEGRRRVYFEDGRATRTVPEPGGAVR